MPDSTARQDPPLLVAAAASVPAVAVGAAFLDAPTAAGHHPALIGATLGLLAAVPVATLLAHTWRSRRRRRALQRQHRVPTTDETTAWRLSLRTPRADVLAAAREIAVQLGRPETLQVEASAGRVSVRTGLSWTTHGEVLRVHIRQWAPGHSLVELSCAPLHAHAPTDERRHLRLLSAVADDLLARFVEAPEPPARALRGPSRSTAARTSIA